MIEVTTAARPVDLEGSISILGTKGTVEVGGFAVNKILTWKFTDEVSVPPVTESYNENPANVYGFGHQKYYENFIKEFAGEDTFVTDAIEGLPSLELIHAIYDVGRDWKRSKTEWLLPKFKIRKIRCDLTIISNNCEHLKTEQVISKLRQNLVMKIT